MASLSIASNASPKLVEHCLREFIQYLKSVQAEQLTGGGNDNATLTTATTSACGSGWDQSVHNNSCDPGNNSKTPSWDKKAIHSYIKRLKHYGNLLKKYINRFPNESENQLATQIIGAISQAIQDSQDHAGVDVVSRSVGPLLELAVSLWRTVQVIDLERLIELLEKNRLAGDAMEGHEVILLCGAAGCGKTTTLHYLAGTVFDEIEVDGFLHMQPKSVADPILASYETSSGRETVTRTLQTAQIEYRGQTLVLCDTPSLVDAEGPEEDIAHGLGIARAIQKARSVRPVLVVSRDGMGVRGRFSAFSETLSSIANLMNGPEGGKVDFRPFHFVFTKYDAKKHKTAISKQFQAVWKQPHAEPGKVQMVRSCVDCIIQDTTPTAKIVTPLEQQPAQLLETILNNRHHLHKPVMDNPAESFHHFASTEALEKLDVQLQICLGDMTQTLMRNDYGTALYRLKQMKQLAELLPEAGEYAKLGVSGMLRHATVLQEQTAEALRREEFDDVIDKLRFLYKFTREVPEAISSAQAGLEMAVQQVIAPRESILHTLEEIRTAVDSTQFSILLKQLKADIQAVIRGEQLRLEIRSIQERILCSDPSDGGSSSELMNVPCMPQRNGDSFCEDQIGSLTELLLTDIPDFQVDWRHNMDGLVNNRSAFLLALARLKEVSTVLKDSPGGAKAAEVCEQAYSKFYGVVDHVLSREDQTCRSSQDLKVFEHQAWFLTLLKEASEVYENSPEGARSYLLYQQAFHKFYGVVEHVLSNAEKNFLASSNDLEAFERQARFLALLRDVSEALQNSPGSARASSVYEQAFTLFYAVVASVLSEAEKSFQSKDRDLAALERQARFLALLKNVNAILQNSPGSERAASAYKHAFGQFNSLISSMLADVEEEYLSDVQDWEALESICWFLALLIQGKLKYKPEVGTEEEKQIKSLEQRLLTLMLRTELEVTDTMKLIQSKKILSFVKTNADSKEEIMTEIQFLNLTELNARRKLLVSVVDKPKVRKLLPSKIVPDEIIASLSHLDKQLAKFFSGQVLTAVQEYNMVVELQKKGKKLLVTRQIAVALRNNIVMAKEDFTTVRGWSKELAVKTESNWRRLGALKKCVDLGITKLDKMIAKERGGYDFSCGALSSLPEPTFLSFCRSSL
ncbi:SecA DEAD-like domain [Seminavis robusta]|uniref:SecA DEAD-like domain n=1 Tax=Seminavis robusta TaxID=568900 RepID=A0A9N8EN27_9STRA|nr:SecA DEAD-like domain [Seminavis robusta]|eukprot:Sro1594_g284610.1 SecA DEAD-like domain (1142) ;mRNA; f:14652-18077